MGESDAVNSKEKPKDERDPAIPNPTPGTGSWLCGHLPHDVSGFSVPDT